MKSSQRRVQVIKGTAALTLLMPILFLYQNCGGGFSSGLSSNSGFSPDTLGSGNYSERLTCTESDRGTADSVSRRLTRSELKASLTQIFGSDIIAKPGVSTALDNFSDETSHTYGRYFDQKITPVYMDGLLATAEAITDILVADKILLSRVLNNCKPDQELQKCVDELTNGFALRVLRRPIPSETKAEINTLIAGEAGVEKLRFGMLRLLLSPYFYQHIETGEQVVGNRVRLSSYEVASRLSFRLIGSSPDDELFRAAASNQLATKAQLETQAKRLLKTQQARIRVKEFFSDWLSLERVPDPDSKIEKIKGVNGVGLGREASEEMLRYVDHIVFERNGTFEELFTSPLIFPSTDRLAKLYGVSRADNAVMSPDGRGGLIMRVATLLGNKLATSPINRGVYLRTRLLCEHLPQPDPTLVAKRLAEVEILDHTKISNRNFVQQTTGIPVCMSCHNMINPLGFALEGYDSFGMPRAKETVYSAAGDPVAEHALDTFVDDLRISSQREFATDARDLVKKIVESDRAKICMSQQILEYTRERAPAAADGCVTNESVAVLEANAPVLDFLVSTTTSEDIYWKSAN